MKKMKILLGVAVITVAGFLMVAADHIDAPAVSGGGASSSTDITDFYAFRAENTDNIAFVANVRGLISPSASSSVDFDENVLIEINIDTNGDAVQDMVMQAIPRDGKMYIFGPFASTSTDLNSTINTDAVTTVVDITPYGSNAISATNASGITAFAGLRDDPFYFDFSQYSEIIAGNATSFNDPGTDLFAGTNVLSLVVEVPKSLIGGTGTINTWVETKSK